MFPNLKSRCCSNLRTHFTLYVNQFPNGLSDTHLKKQAAYATNFDDKQDVAMFWYWIRIYQNCARMPVLLVVELEYSRDRLQHAALRNFAGYLDLVMPDVD